MLHRFGTVLLLEQSHLITYNKKAVTAEFEKNPVTVARKKKLQNRHTAIWALDYLRLN